MQERLLGTIREIDNILFDYERFETQLRMAVQNQNIPEINQLVHDFKSHYKELRVKGDKARSYYKMILDIQRRFHRTEAADFSYS